LVPFPIPGTFAFEPRRIRSVRDDIFQEGYFSIFDILVYLKNKGDITLDYEFTRAVRYKHPLGCLVVRIANFEAFAEKLSGDSREGILVALADGLRQCIRNVDHLFRSGSAEFTVVLPETGTDGCRVVTERLLAGAADLSLFGMAISPQPEILVGTACYPEAAATDAKELMATARQALS